MTSADNPSEILGIGSAPPRLDRARDREAGEDRVEGRRVVVVRGVERRCFAIR